MEMGEPLKLVGGAVTTLKVVADGRVPPTAAAPPLSRNGLPPSLPSTGGLGSETPMRGGRIIVFLAAGNPFGTGRLESNST